MRRRGYGPLVVVIGAGAAGLAAASMLAEHQVDVVVLEARDRVGGRVWTVRDWGKPIDVGASWIHGTMGNPVTGLRDRYGIETRPTDVTSFALHWEGKRVDERTTGDIRKAAEEVIEQVDHPTPTRRVDEPLATIVKAALDGRKLDGLALAGVRFHLWEHIQNEWASDPDRLSAAWYKDTKFEGEQEVFPGGYDRVFQKLAEGLDVRTGHDVIEIRYGRDGVIVDLGPLRQFHADYAIVTVPLGVLKEGGPRFSPPLPAPKWEAITRLDMGVLSKTWLRFPAPFWKGEPWARVHACLRPNQDRWSSWYDFTDVAGGEAVLLGLNGGRAARAIERLETEEVKAEALAVLQGSFPDATIDANGVEIIQSRWSTDRRSRGSYSNIPPGATPDDRDALAEPVLGRLLFAGEATHRTCSQTVHGAVLSGWREARRILSAL